MGAWTRRRAWGRALGVGVAAVCAAFALHLASAREDEAHLEQANVLALAGRYEAAIAQATRADAWTTAPRADALRAYAHLRLRQLEPAADAFSAALRRQPNNWILQRDYAITLLALGRREQAQARMRRALRLNPRLDVPPGFTIVSG